jgi:hypothetical protein
MVHRGTRIQRARPWLYAALVVPAIAAAVVMWLSGRHQKDWAVPHGIYASAQLADAYHAYRRDYGRWPQPGTVVAKEVEYVRTFGRGGMRYDVFNFGGGQYVHLELHDDGRLIALPVRGDEPATRGAG